MFGWLALVAVGVIVYRMGVKRGLLVELERRWAADDAAFLDRLRATKHP